MSSALLQLMATRGAVAAAWTPSNLSNKVGWWRASDITGKSDGDSVTAWPDSFGLLSDATGSGTYKTGANGIGGVQAIQFSQTLGFSTGYTGTPTDFFCWGVCTLGSVANSFERIFDKSGAVEFIVGRNNYANGLVFGVPGKRVAIATAAANIYFLAGRTGSSAVFEVSTASTSTACSAIPLSNVGMVIGAPVNPTDYNARLEGLISEVGFLDGYPSADDLTNLRAYITDTYGITTS